MPASLVLGFASSSQADSIFTPGDQILGGQTNTGTNQFLTGVVGTTAGTNNWPTNESPDHAIDGVAQKYLNFGITNTGILVNPSFNGGNGSVVTSMQLWTANDAEQRDPSSYQIWGTNTALDFSQTTFDLSLFTQISFGSLALPSGRGTTGTNPLNNTNSQTVTFSNVTGYKEYLIVFPTVKNTPIAANSMQIGEIQLFGIAAFTELKWTGSSSNIWNIGGAQNWTVGGNPSTFSNTNGVTFDDTATGSTTISVVNSGTAVQPAAVLFANNTKNYTIGGDGINSTGTLTVNGTGTVTLNNVNNYTAGTTVNAGTLIIGPAGSLGSGALTINNANAGAGTAVAVTFNSAQSIGNLSGTIATPASGTNSLTITISGGITITQTTEAIFPGVITGTGGLTKNGSSPLTLTGVNTYTGPTVINTGVLRSSAPGDNPQGALPAGQSVTVNADGTLLFGTDDGVGYYAGSASGITVNGGTVVGATSTHSTLPAVTLNAGTLGAADAGNFSNGSVLNYILDGDITTVAGATASNISANSILLRKKTSDVGTSSPVTFNVPRGTAAADLVVSSVVKDQAAGLIKSGNGILSLTNANTYTGGTTVNSGTVAVYDSAALGTGGVTLGNGAVLALGADTINGFAGFSLNGGATVDGSNSVLTLTTNIGNLARSAYSPQPVSIADGFTTSFLYTVGGNRAADGITFTIQNVSPSVVGGGGGGLGYSGIASSAAVEFNIYTGNGNPVGTSYNVGGTIGPYVGSSPVNFANGNPISITLNYSSIEQTMTETLFDLVTHDTYTNTFNGVNIAAAIGSSSGYVGFTGATGGSFASNTIANFNFNNFSQGVALPNSVSVPANATVGLSVLPVPAGGAGSATMQGALTLGSNATLNVTGGSTITNLPYTLIASGGATIAGNTTIDVAKNGLGDGLFILTSIADSATGATLTKTGAGTLAILGAATYTGNTSVNGGKLIVNGSISGSTIVNNGGTLAGRGTLGGVTVASGGAIAPGTSVDTITTGPLSLMNGAALQLEMSSITADQIKVNGGATLTGVINLAISLLVDPVDNTTFTVLDGSAALSGYSSGARLSYLGTQLNEGQLFTVVDGGFTQSFTISYLADSGKDITLTAVPEPSVAGILVSCFGATLGLRRRRQRSA